VTNLAGQIKSGASSLEINLQPESLGKIKLMLQMNEGSLSVRIIAHTEETRNLLDSSLQNIKDSLSQLGINLNDMSVDLANQEKHGNQTGSGYREESKPGKLFGESKESYDNIGIREQSSLQSNRLNILA
jgi:flagellar hook-length control protein FliK